MVSKNKSRIFQLLWLRTSSLTFSNVFAGLMYPPRAARIQSWTNLCLIFLDVFCNYLSKFEPFLKELERLRHK